jgi:protein-tyrosine-phosphatase
MCERIAIAVSRRLQPAVARLLRIPFVREAFHRRALRAWRRTEAPLILCYGNINRSPFAAALARRDQSKSPTSAGFYRSAGRPAPELTVQRAAAYGVDLHTHRSATVQTAQLDRAAAIFVFDLMNLAPIACRAPRALRRTHLLATLAATDGAFIDDPHGQPPEVLDETLAKISQAVGSAGDVAR